jgi:hypothetical protein
VVANALDGGATSGKPVAHWADVLLELGPAVLEKERGLFAGGRRIGSTFGRVAGAGAFVAELNSSLSRSVRRKIISQQLELIAVEAIHMQMDKKTLTELFNSTLEKFKY